MENENNQILISWIEEYTYCPRRFYLKVIENYTGSNIYMVEGIINHKNVDRQRTEKRKDYVQVFSLEVYSKKYDLYGKCDCVEFLYSENGVYIPFLNNKYKVIPIEYKHGHTRNEKEYNLQLIAQVICIEEMYDCHIEEGYIYYTDSKERYRVIFDEKQRKETIAKINEIKQELKTARLIEPKYMKRCHKCSV